MERFRANVFETFSPENEAIAHYRPTYLDKGGDRLVFEVSDHPDVVVKASTFAIKDILSENSGGDLTSLKKTTKAEFMQDISIKSQQEKELKNYFDSGSVLPEKRYLMKVPVSPEILDEIFKDDWQKRVPPIGYKGIEEAWTVVAVQKKVENIDSPETISFHFGGLLEELELDEEKRERLATILAGKESLSKENIEFFLRAHSLKGGKLDEIYKLIESDTSFKESLRNFISRAINYSNRTGNTLALAGNNNLIFERELQDAKWIYKLIDALPLYSEKMLDVTRTYLGKLEEDSKNGVSERKKTIVIKTINYVRVINFFAELLGLEERIILA